jgi:hypothetical protein
MIGCTSVLLKMKTAVHQAAAIAGIRAILVHAISQEAKQFYSNCGFTPSPVAPMTLMITIKDAKAALGIE